LGSIGSTNRFFLTQVFDLKYPLDKDNSIHLVGCLV
jgi:hypothetical protein